MKMDLRCALRVAALLAIGLGGAAFSQSAKACFYVDPDSGSGYDSYRLALPNQCGGVVYWRVCVYVAGEAFPRTYQGQTAPRSTSTIELWNLRGQRFNVSWRYGASMPGSCT
jgi:hypothetical protein